MLSPFLLVEVFIIVVTALPQPADDLFQDSTVDVSAIDVGGLGKRGDCRPSHECYYSA